MSASVMQRRTARARPKMIMFAAIATMLAYTLYHTEHFLIDPKDPAWPHYRGLAPWLIPHGIVGAVALTLSFMQFSHRLRARYLPLHRLCGRIYLAAALIAAPYGVYISYLDLKDGYTWSFVASSAVLALLWLFATFVAYGLILRRQVEQHRQWMTRSLAMSLVFLEVRVLGGMTGWEDTPDGATAVVWICVALGYPLADAVLQIEQYLNRRPVTGSATGPHRAQR